MLILGHTGITLGAAVVLSGALQSRENKQERRLSHPPETHSGQINSSSGISSWLTFLGNHIDIRFLLIGSLLPDIIDKPVGMLLLRGSLGSGRIFCHTLLFLLLITLTGIYFYRSHSRTWFLVLSFSTFTHLICDQMWLETQILLWPLYGWTWEKVDPAYWAQHIIYNLHADPAVYVPELVGAAILIWFVVVLVRRRKFYAFVRNGQVQ